jgi:hypothetical protein
MDLSSSGYLENIRHTLLNIIMDAETWHISLKDDSIVIREALKTMESWKLYQEDVPFIIRFFEHPDYMILPGAVTLDNHDIIHILLSRGALPKDEAFVIGFTMGTTRQVNCIDRGIFKFATRFLYPDGYRFGPDEHKVFDIGLQAATAMKKCPDLSMLDLSMYIDYTVKEARKSLNIDCTELTKRYALEKALFTSVECQRLL